MGQAALKSVETESSLDVSGALEVVSACAAEGREKREIPKKAIEAIRKTGYFRSFLPKQYGGLERPPQEFFKASVDIAERDMGTAWASGIIAVHAYQLSLMDPQAAKDVYDSGPDTFISSSYNPAGAKVETAEGGFMLSGQWGWSSGSGHCDWVLLGGLIFDQGKENIHLASDPDVTRRVAEAANLIDETEAIMYRNFDEMMDHVNAGREIPMKDRVKYRYQASLVIERMMQAVDMLFDVAGGRSVYRNSPIQDIWHDIHIARAHVANNPISFARNLGAVHLGADSTDVFV